MAQVVLECQRVQEKVRSPFVSNIRVLNHAEDFKDSGDLSKLSYLLMCYDCLLLVRFSFMSLLVFALSSSPCFLPFACSDICSTCTHSIGPCGHVFCYTCLVRVFRDVVRDTLRVNEDFLPYRLRFIPDPITSEWGYDLRTAIGWPDYRCPECRLRLFAKPFKIPLMVGMGEALREVIGPSTEETSLDGLFTGYFP